MTQRVAIVTGASRGIGAHLARGLLGAGWSVAATSRSGTQPDGSHPSADLVVIASDVTDVHAVARTVGEVVERFGRIDLLVNNAGVIEPELPLWESNVDEWWGVMEVNVRGAYLMSRAVVPHMLDRGGRIINLNSGAGTAERADLTAYCASKSALARITGGVALAGAPHGVFAFDLAPGVVRTDMSTAMDLHQDRTDWTDPDDVVELALALADGILDDYSGRMVRAGTDTVEGLLSEASTLDEDSRRLRLMP